MKGDVRDDAIAEALDGAARIIESTPEKLPHVRRKGNRRRAVRWAAIIAALTTFTGGVGWAALAHKPPGTKPSSAPTRAYADHSNGWSFRYPRAWRVQLFTSCQAAAEGILIANDTNRFTRSEKPGACGAWDFTGHSENLALVQIIHAPFAGGEPRDTQFPLSLYRFARPSILGVSGVPADQWGLNVVQGGRFTYQVWVWFGPRASRTDREAARHLVASIRFQAASIETHRVPRLGICPTARGVATDVPPRPPAVRGDIDGDGRNDRAAVVDVPGFPDACSRFVVVQTVSGRLAARLYEWWAPQMPKVAALARIETARGSDLVVTFDAGGFSRQVAILSIRDGKLVLLTLPEIFIVVDAPREAANLDCAGPGTGEIVWTTTGSQRGPTTDVLRRFYRLIGTRFQLEPPRTERLRVPTADIGTPRIAPKAPELANLKDVFSSCRVR
jgi:hypothetical protein